LAWESEGLPEECLWSRRLADAGLGSELRVRRVVALPLILRSTAITEYYCSGKNGKLASFHFEWATKGLAPTPFTNPTPNSSQLYLEFTNDRRLVWDSWVRKRYDSTVRPCF